MDWEEVSRLLEQAYGNPRHGNPVDPTDCLFYLMLSRKTPIKTAARAYGRLRALAPDWNDLLHLDQAAVSEAIYGSGLEGIRSQDLIQVAQLLQERFGAVSLESLRQWSDGECLRLLAGLPGVGNKTAYCVMMYSLGRQVFPADAHCIRILQRMGVIPAYLRHRPAQRALGNAVPPELAYVLHVNLVAHGQELCRAGRPHCELCVVQKYCVHARMHASDHVSAGQLNYSADNLIDRRTSRVTKDAR